MKPALCEHTQSITTDPLVFFLRVSTGNRYQVLFLLPHGLRVSVRSCMLLRANMTV